MVSFQDLKELQDRYKSQTKDLRDAIAQRKIAMEEFTDINERCDISKFIKSVKSNYAKIKKYL